jgi:hypothetical protein
VDGDFAALLMYSRVVLCLGGPAVRLGCRCCAALRAGCLAGVAALAGPAHPPRSTLNRRPTSLRSSASPCHPAYAPCAVISVSGLLSAATRRREPTARQAHTQGVRGGRPEGGRCGPPTQHHHQRQRNPVRGPGAKRSAAPGDPGGPTTTRTRTRTHSQPTAPTSTSSAGPRPVRRRASRAAPVLRRARSGPARRSARSGRPLAPSAPGTRRAGPRRGGLRPGSGSAPAPRSWRHCARRVGDPASSESGECASPATWSAR